MNGKCLNQLDTNEFLVTLYDGGLKYKRIEIKQKYSGNRIQITDIQQWNDLIIAMAQLLIELGD